MKYDVFISYRRDGGYDTAKHLNDLLVRDGYRVSFDIDTLRNGDFDIQLLSRIEECKDFILIVDQHAFDRTLDKNFNPSKDWMRCELAHALKHNKNIIPVFLSGTTDFPDGLPVDIVNVTKKNGLEYSKYYFDSFYKTLKKRFLHKRNKRTYFIVVSILLFLSLISFMSKIVEIGNNTEIIEFSNDNKQTIIEEYQKRPELPIQERADIVDVINTFIIDDLTEYNVQSWSVFREYTKKHQLIPLSKGLEWLDTSNKECVEPAKLDFVSKLVYKNKNFDSDMFGQANIQHITLMGPHAGATLLSISSGYQSSYEISNEFIQDAGFSTLSNFILGTGFYSISKKKDYWLVEISYRGSGGNSYEWIISMGKDLINKYLRIYYAVPKKCNVFEINDGAHFTPLDLIYYYD